jgi:hypothetical protein
MTWSAQDIPEAPTVYPIPGNSKESSRIHYMSSIVHYYTTFFEPAASPFLGTDTNKIQQYKTTWSSELIFVPCQQP